MKNVYGIYGLKLVGVCGGKGVFMGLDQFFYETRGDEDSQIFYFRKNWDFHWDLERYFDTEITNREYFPLTIDDVLEMVDIEDFYCLRPILDEMIDKDLSEILYQPWW